MSFKIFKESQEVLLEAVKFGGDVSTIKVDTIAPDQKDVDRVANINDAKASSMAKKITDPIKLVRRTKAYVNKFGKGNNPFFDRMREMGFDDKQISSIEDKANIAIVPEPELADPVPHSGKKYKPVFTARRGQPSRGRFYIMNASVIYKGKLSKVMPDLWGRSVILLGKTQSGASVAIVGSASSMKDNVNGLDYYEIAKGASLDYTIDTGNGYRTPSSEIFLTDYILVDDGKPLTKFEDKSYKYYVFK